MSGQSAIPRRPIEINRLSPGHKPSKALVGARDTRAPLRLITLISLMRSRARYTAGPQEASAASPHGQHVQRYGQIRIDSDSPSPPALSPSARLREPNRAYRRASRSDLRDRGHQLPSKFV